MAKSKNPKIGTEVKAAPVAAIKSSTPVRNTAIPKAAAPARREITHDMIARRAYEISCSGSAGSELENWCRAERELRG